MIQIKDDHPTGEIPYDAERVMELAAKELSSKLLSSELELRNLANYCGDLSRKLDCDLWGELRNPSKDIHKRYGLNYANRSNIVWAIVERFFKDNIKEDAK